MTRSAPSIPLFGDAYLADTRHLSLEEHGAYLQLLMIAWRVDGCQLPNDDARIARMLGVTPKKWAKLRPTVMAFWTLENDAWTQKRLSKERRFVAKKSEDNRDAANARWGAKSLKNNGTAYANAMPNECIIDAPPPPPIKEKKEVTANAASFEFDGRVIRLTALDFKRWAKAHPLLDLRAVLQSRDDWLSTEADEASRKKWFISTSNHLASLSQRAKREERDQDGWGAMP